MAYSPDDAARFAADGRTGLVRLKMPREGSLVIADQIRVERAGYVRSIACQD